MRLFNFTIFHPGVKYGSPSLYTNAQLKSQDGYFQGLRNPTGELLINPAFQNRTGEPKDQRRGYTGMASDPELLGPAQSVSELDRKTPTNVSGSLFAATTHFGWPTDEYTEAQLAGIINNEVGPAFPVYGNVNFYGDENASRPGSTNTSSFLVVSQSAGYDTATVTGSIPGIEDLGLSEEAQAALREATSQVVASWLFIVEKNFRG